MTAKGRGILSPIAGMSKCLQVLELSGTYPGANFGLSWVELGGFGPPRAQFGHTPAPHRAPGPHWRGASPSPISRIIVRGVRSAAAAASWFRGPLPKNPDQVVTRGTICWYSSGR